MENLTSELNTARPHPAGRLVSRYQAVQCTLRLEEGKIMTTTEIVLCMKYMIDLCCTGICEVKSSVLILIRERDVVVTVLDMFKKFKTCLLYNNT